MSIERNTPKEILRDEEIEKAIKEVKKFNEKNRFRDGGVLNNSIDILFNYINELEESHAYVFDAYQDLGIEHFNFIESIEKKLEELKKEKEDYIKEYPGWNYDLDCIDDIRVMDAEIRILESVLPEPIEEDRRLNADKMFEDLGYKRKSLGVYDEFNIMYAKYNDDSDFINFIPRA